MVKDIDKFYFDEKDYDTFLPEKQSLRSKDVMDARKVVQQKLLDLNKEVLPILQKMHLDLHNHYNPNNITSVIMPCDFNKFKVNWLGVRYGRSKRQLSQLNYGLSAYNKEDKDDILGFQKYACMQINIDNAGVDVGMYFAVPHGSVDREYLRQVILDDLKYPIIEELQKLKGFGYVWSLWNTNIDKQLIPDFSCINPISPESSFSIDHQDVKEFPEWWYKNDVDGCYSSMLVHFPRWDERISKDNIVETCVRVISHLYDFYTLIRWKSLEDCNSEKEIK